MVALETAAAAKRYRKTQRNAWRRVGGAPNWILGKLPPANITAGAAPFDPAHQRGLMVRGWGEGWARAFFFRILSIVASSLTNNNNSLHNTMWITYVVSPQTGTGGFRVQSLFIIRVNTRQPDQEGELARTPFFPSPPLRMPGVSTSRHLLPRYVGMSRKNGARAPSEQRKKHCSAGRVQLVRQQGLNQHGWSSMNIDILRMHGAARLHDSEYFLPRLSKPQRLQEPKLALKPQLARTSSQPLTHHPNILPLLTVLYPWVPTASPTIKGWPTSLDREMREHLLFSV